MFLDSVSDLGALVVVNTLQDGHTLQEVFVLGALSLRGVLHDMVKRISVQLPQGTLCLRLDCGRTWRIVKESKLSKGVTWLIGF